MCTAEAWGCWALVRQRARILELGLHLGSSGPGLSGERLDRRAKCREDLKRTGRRPHPDVWGQQRPIYSARPVYGE